MRFFKLLLPLAVVVGRITASPISAQTQLVTSNYFPAEMEFKELKAIQKDVVFSDAHQLAALQDGPILLEAGLKNYAQRTYALAEPGSLSIEVMTLADSRGAYSLVSLLKKTGVQAGPPGDFHVGGVESLIFSSGRFLVRIRTSAPGDLPRRIAISVANRLGQRGGKAPNLVGHFPKGCCDPLTIRYFVGPLALKALGSPVAGIPIAIPAEVEAAQELCTLSGQTGTLTLLNFPTIQLAEAYFDASAVFLRDPSKSPNLYTRQTGTLVGILEGNFAADAADKTLGSIKFSYSVKWIFDKNNQQNRAIWGVPVRILGTVLRSLLFTVFLCLVSIVMGILLASGRMFIHRRWGRSDDSEFIRLKIDED